MAVVSYMHIFLSALEKKGKEKIYLNESKVNEIFENSKLLINHNFLKI